MKFLDDDILKAFGVGAAYAIGYVVFAFLIQKLIEKNYEFDTLIQQNERLNREVCEIRARQFRIDLEAFGKRAENDGIFTENPLN